MEIENVLRQVEFDAEQTRLELQMKTQQLKDAAGSVDDLKQETVILKEQLNVTECEVCDYL